ncbi:MAG TPA: hypothetical protein DD620_03000, partial [Verrucomicrobia bacterium]|nr:hypothetical protein [Verrucomicrobiota bacterium]
MSANIGKVIGVNGNLLKVEFENPVILNEVAYAKLSGTEIKLKSEVIRVRGNQAELQVFEDTTGLKVGDLVETPPNEMHALKIGKNGNEFIV